MEFRTIATGDRRKKLVTEMTTYLNSPIHYDGAPTFGYTVGEYQIDKAGTITGPYNRDMVETLAERGFTGVIIGEEESVPETEDTPAFEDLQMTEAEELGLGRQRREDPQGESGPQPDDVPEPDTIAIEMPLDGFTPEKLDNLTKLINSKAGLIRAALGDRLADSGLPVRMDEQKLRFPWFTANLEPDEFTAWAWFISALCKAAKDAKRVTAKDRPGDNMKFSFRVFLIRLGMIGDEYKTARKILLRNLSGNSAFSKGSQPTYTVNCYTLENGNEEDAMECESFDFHSLAKAKARADEFLADCESLYFAGVHVEDEKGDYLYEITMDGTVHEK